MHAVFVQPYRLFFLGAAWFAVVHMTLWTLYLATGIAAPAANPFLWHGYEMVFGFAAAVVTGFLLTAAANWTGRATVNAPVLAIMAAAWLVARVNGLVAGPPWVSLVADGIVLWGLFAAFARVLIVTGNWRNYRLLPIIAGLAAAAGAWQLAAAGMLPDWRYPLLHGAVDLLLILMVIMGGRVIPFFTGRRLPQLDVQDPAWLGLGAGALVLLSVLAYWLGPAHVAAALSWFAACFVLARLLHWSPLGTRHEPMLWILHLGYLWLAVALFLRGGSLAWDWLPWSATLHAVVVSAMGCLILGMIARVALGHGGHPIRAPWWLVPAFALVALAAIPRLLGAWPALFDPQIAYAAAGIAWTVAFAIYAVGFIPLLLGRCPSPSS